MTTPPLASAGTPDARTEVRAVYAGIPLAFAGSLSAASGHGRGDGAVLRTVGAASAGMALARFSGSVAERRLAPWPTGAFLVLEAALAVALGVAARAGVDAGRS
jgi:energy-converting hydrogenase Eha subunit E